MRGRGLPLLALLLLPLPATGLASPWVENGPSRVRLETAYRTAPAAPAPELRLGLHFRLDPEWHVYWKNSGDAGYPPTLGLQGSPTPVAGELLWPAPRRFELKGGLVAFGYEREVIYPVRARWAAAAPGGAERLTADLDYLVCQVDCIPFHSRLALDQPAGSPDPDPETAPGIERAFRELPATLADLPGVTAETAFEPADSGGGGGAGGRPALAVRLRGAAAAPRGTDLFLEPQDLFETGKPEVLREPQGLRFRVPLTPRQLGRPLPAAFPFAWTATGVHPLAGGAGEVAVAGRETVPLRSHPAALAADPTQPGVAPAARAVALAGGAVLATLLALGLWGFLGPREAPGERGAPRPPTRDALGFLAAGATVVLLYLLSRTVRAEGLAAVEVSLLGMALCGWLRRIAPVRSKLSWALLAALGLCAGLGVWLAAQSRLG